jgi:hypothetical protein
MPHPLPAFALAVAVPLLAAGLHAAAPAYRAAAGATHATPAGVLPHNLCESCHGSSRSSSVTLQDGGLDARELAATHAYLQGALPQRG